MESCGSSLPAVTLQHVVYMYVAADKYDNPHLRKEMLDSFKDRAGILWPVLGLSHKLVDIIKSVYNNTSWNDDLRQVVVACSLSNLSNLLQSHTGDFRALLEDTPDFGADIIMNLPRRSSTCFLLQQIPPSRFAIAISLSRGPLQSEFHLAAKQGNAEYCKILIAEGQDIDALHINGETALHLAAWFGHLEIAQLLVESGAEINSKMNLGASPIILARIQNHQQITAYLVNRASS
jgi:ankyrin repeat protein